jgi:hypothetical protein
VRLARQCCRKTSGVNKDLQVLSEVNSVIPDKPGHTFKQITETWKSSGSGDLANFWATAVEQQDAVGGDMKVRGYGTAHNANGDLSYSSWEGTSKVTPKEGGAVELTGSGQFNWLGGAGKYQKISGQGTYTCKGNQAGVECLASLTPAPRLLIHSTPYLDCIRKLGRLLPSTMNLSQGHE